MPIPHSTTNGPETMFWAETSHSTVLLPKSPITPDILECSDPSSRTLAQLGKSILNLNEALLKTTDSKNEKKGKFECLE